MSLVYWLVDQADSFGHTDRNKGCDYQTWLADIRKNDTNSVSYVALQCLAAAFFARSSDS